ncbi:endolytic transglycosylase MltG [Ancylomarina longa]|uniref:Endolytic murein transglycosylase n=1 Tax=Ancylomarina longa TaxID=2487017 RepID=A0A434AUV7_9BACT|nr:endolytic transglycosylase MltG [Ancylomarina longa]RUT78222.1 endolytic transglycosylase MltG [Ancylomarina longa]
MINLARLRDNRSTMWRIIVLVLMLILIITGAILFHLYTRVYSQNINLGGKQTDYLYIPSGSTQVDVLNTLQKNTYLENRNSLDWVMTKKNYSKNVKAGRYQLKNGMNNNELVNLLRSGIQSPVHLTFNNTRTLEDFSGKISRQIEADSIQILNLLRNKAEIGKYGFLPETIIAMFIPNTYQVYWNTSANEFVDRMYKEYIKFWNVDRLKRAEAIGLSPVQISTLASIVDEETIKNDEKARVAGVYLNRLKRKIKLDADPTLKFALGDFSIKRILNKDKKIDSPYNTYKYRGLPPGPIRQASISGINAVLHYEKHRYFYFCAKPDFSGYHNFASSLREHNNNSRKYWKALNHRGIKR